MKKIVLSLAGVLAATAFAPEAAAVPSFARQTGMACNACHFQSYPALTAFGRAFKGGGYTMMGAQEKIEGEHGLSIPAVLNASLYVQLRYNKTNGTTPTAGASAGSKNAGRFDFPDEMALFLGGRGSDNLGMLAEIATGPTGTHVANFKMPFVFDMSSVKISAIPFWTDSLGAGAGYDLFATGSNGAGRVTENGFYSAAMYMGSTNNPNPIEGGIATGVALVAANENFHVNLSPYTGAPGGSTAKLGATYLRAGWTPSMNNWDFGLGLQSWSGHPFRGQSAIIAPALVAQSINDAEARLTVIDAQAQGEVSGMPLGIYASYGWAPTSTLTAASLVTGAGVNIYNQGVNRKSSFGMLADLWVMPGTLGIQAGFMRAHTGNNNAATLANESDNSLTIGARYKVRQNVKLGLAYTKFSGSAYDIGGSGGTNACDQCSNIVANAVATTSGAAAGRGNSRFTAILSAGF